eukprot:364218-Chlamydomonas_euryale.AAC.14
MKWAAIQKVPSSLSHATSATLMGSLSALRYLRYKAARMPGGRGGGELMDGCARATAPLLPCL